MPTAVALLPHDLAVIAALVTIGKPVGFAVAPPGALAAAQAGGPDYMILYPVNSVRDGSLADPYADVELVCQVTCVGRLADGVVRLGDLCGVALQSVAIPGRSVMQVIPEDGGQVRPDFNVTPAVFIATPRWRILTTPA